MGIHGVTYRTAERRTVGPIHLELSRRQRVLLRCDSEPAYAAFLDVLTGGLEPLTGRLVELDSVRVQTDRRLREQIQPGQSVRELMERYPLPESIWLAGRRRSVPVVMDRLDLSPNLLRWPLKLLDPGVLDRFWALRFVASEADLLIGREVFLLTDERIRRVLRERWLEFPATVICAAPEEALPGPAHVLLVIEADGSSRVEPLAQAPEAAEE
jgi:hypothetical protein